MTAGARLALTAACAVVVIIGMRITAEVIAPVILAFVVTVAIAPVLGWFMRRGLSRMSAYALTLTVTLLAALFTVVLLSASLASFALGLPDYADEIQPYWDWAVRFFDTLGVDLNSLFSLKDLDPKSLVEAGVALVGSLTNLLSVLTLMGFVFAFMLLDATTIARKLEAGMLGRALGAAVRLTTELRAFVKVTAYLGAAVAILETILLLVLGVPNALLWGLLSFFLSFIPYVGFILALIPPALLALITGGWVAALVVDRRLRRHQHRLGQRDQAARDGHRDQPLAAHRVRLPGAVGLGPGAARRPARGAHDADRQGPALRGLPRVARAGDAARQPPRGGGGVRGERARWWRAGGGRLGSRAPRRRDQRTT